MFDIVYILKDTIKNPELRYSLRSLEQNFPNHRVIFVGGCPKGLTPDEQLKIKQNQSKWENGRANILEACKCDKLTENIYLFNDDFFIMKPQNLLPVYSNGKLDEFIEMVEKNTGETSFVRRLKKVYQVLMKEHLTTKNYEVHVPMLINRKKMLEVAQKFATVPCLRSLYGNYYQVSSVEIDSAGKMQDGVQQTIWGKINPTRILVSTTDESFKGMAGKQIKEMFPKPSKYERKIYG